MTVTATDRRQGRPRRAEPAAVCAPTSASADGATSVTVHGADPAGGAVAIDLTAPGGALIAHTSAAARIGSGLDATATLPFAAPPGSVVTAAQGPWSSTHAARDRRVHGRRVRGRDPLLGSGLRWRSYLHHGHLLLVARAARPCGLGGQHRRARAVRRTRARRVRRERLRRIRGNGAQHCGGDGRVARGRRQRDGRPDRAVPRDIQPAHHRRWRARLARRRQPPRTRNTPPARGCVHLLTPRPAAGAAHDADGTHQPDGRRRSRARARRLSASRRRRGDGRPERRRGRLGAARVPLPPGRNAGRIRAVGSGGRGRPRARRARPGRRRRFATRDRIGFRGLRGRPRRSVSRRSRSSSARPTRPPTA